MPPAHASTGDQCPQPRPVPWPGIQPATFCFAGQHSTSWATLVRAAFPLNLLPPNDFHYPFRLTFCFSVLCVRSSLWANKRQVTLIALNSNSCPLMIWLHCVRHLLQENCLSASQLYEVCFWKLVNFRLLKIGWLLLLSTIRGKLDFVTFWYVISQCTHLFTCKKYGSGSPYSLRAVSVASQSSEMTWYTRQLYLFWYNCCHLSLLFAYDQLLHIANFYSSMTELTCLMHTVWYNISTFKVYF